eukprot:COSAG05_NODE_1534_length_4616_cov_6.656409_1_plen_80_part_00
MHGILILVNVVSVLCFGVISSGRAALWAWGGGVGAGQCVNGSAAATCVSMVQLQIIPVRHPLDLYRNYAYASYSRGAWK